MLSMGKHPIQSEEAHQMRFDPHEKQYDCLCHSIDDKILFTVSFSLALKSFNGAKKQY